MSGYFEQYKEQGKINEPAYRQANGNTPDRIYGRVDTKNHGRPYENDGGRGISQEGSQKSNLTKNITSNNNPYATGKLAAMSQASQAQNQIKTTNTKTIKPETQLVSGKPLVRGR